MCRRKKYKQRQERQRSKYVYGAGTNVVVVQEPVKKTKTARDPSVGEVPLLRSILEVQSTSRATKRMEDHIKVLAAEYNADTVVDEGGNLYITKGQTAWYPCIVAHTDTVHDIVEDDDYEVHFEDAYYYAWNPTTKKQLGVGGDDKVGIYVALAALRDFDNIKVAFFYDEEIGCVGSRKANPDFFKDVRWILEADRRGFGDFVDNINGPLMSHAFKSAIKPILDRHGYKFSHGAMTDVEALKKQVPVCMANMSCGYYGPHTSNEVVDTSEVEICRQMIYDIINEVEERRWDHVSRPKFQSTTHTYHQGNHHNHHHRQWTGFSEGWGDSLQRGSYYQQNPAIPATTGTTGKPDVSRLADHILINEGAESTMPCRLPNTYYDPNAHGLFYFGKRGLFECVGVFTTNLRLTEKSIRESLDLPQHLTITLNEHIAVCPIEIDLGLHEADTLTDAYIWAEQEMLALADKYKHIVIEEAQCRLLVGIDREFGKAPF